MRTCTSTAMSVPRLADAASGRAACSSLWPNHASGSGPDPEGDLDLQGYTPWHGHSYSG
jgi:hypothetical protein